MSTLKFNQYKLTIDFTDKELETMELECSNFNADNRLNPALLVIHFVDGNQIWFNMRKILCFKVDRLDLS